MRPAVVGSRTTDPVEHFELRVGKDGSYLQPFRPIEAVLLWQSPRISRALHLLQGGRGRTAERSLPDQKATHVGDQPDRIDSQGTDVRTRLAGRAGPEALGLDYLAVKTRALRFSMAHPRADRIQGPPQILYHIPRRKRLAGFERGTGVLAPAAGDAGIKRQKLPARQVLQPLHANLPGFFKLFKGDRLQAAQVFLGGGEVEPARDDVQQAGIWEGGNDSEHQDGVHPPEHEMDRVGIRLAHSCRDKELRHSKSDEGQLGMGCGFPDDAESLDEVTGQPDREERNNHNPVENVVANAGFGSTEATPDEPHTPSQEKESKEIEGDLVDRKVEPLVEERVVCPAAEDQRGIFLDSNQDGAHEEHREPPEHQCVHGPGSTLGAAHRALRHHLGPEPAHSSSPVDLGLGRAAHPPEPNPTPDSPGKDAQRQECQTVKDQFGNGIDVPKNLSRQLLVAGDQPEYGRKLLKVRRQGSRSVPGQLHRHRQPIHSRQTQRSEPPDHC